MTKLYNKANAFYLIVGTLAALTSVVLITVFNAPPFVTIALVALFTLAIIKIINDRAEINGLVKNLADVKQHLEAEKTKVFDAEKKIQDLESTIQGKETKLAEGERRIKELEDMVKCEETKLASVKKKIQDLENTIQNQEAKLAKGEKIIKELEDIMKRKETELSAAKREIVEKNAEITSLKKGMETLGGITEYTQKQEIELIRKRSGSLPSFSLLGSKASSSTHSLS